MMHLLQRAMRCASALVVAGGAAALGGCHHVSVGAAGDVADASSIAVTSCDGQSASSRDAIAALSISVTPAATPSSPVAIEVEGEANKSLTRDSTDQVHRYELPRGVYVVRVTMTGYNATSARVTLSAGCNAQLSATMRRRTAKGR